MYLGAKAINNFWKSAVSYKIKEMFVTLQGEGARAGRIAVFCRFSGCNLWSGREKDRNSAVCDFCDTDFIGVDGVGGGKYLNAEDLASSIEREWLSKVETNDERVSGYKYVVFTGGEPGLQLDSVLVKALQKRGFECAVETNGTIKLPSQLDWVTVSPKSSQTLVTVSGNELKLVYPQASIEPKSFLELDFEYFFLQPMDCPAYRDNLKKTIKYCLRNPPWRLSLQTHKVAGIP